MRRSFSLPQSPRPSSQSVGFLAAGVLHIDVLDEGENMDTFLYVELIEDKFVTVKEELEEIIDEVKNDVDEKAVQISNNKRSQEQSFEQLHTAMNKLRKDLKQLGN